MKSEKAEVSPAFPTDWETLSGISAVFGEFESRQLSENTFEIRSPTHSLVIPREGFELFRYRTSSKWNRWLDSYKNRPIPRTDLNG